MMIGMALGLILGAVVAIAALPGLWWHLVNQYELRCGMIVWRCKQAMPMYVELVMNVWNVSVYARVWRVRTWYCLAVFGTV